MRAPAFARSSARASSSPACALPVRPTAPSSGSASCSGLSRSDSGMIAIARALVPSRITVARSAGPTPALFSARVAVSSTTGPSVSAPKRSSHCFANGSLGRRHTSRISVVADARPITRAIASESGPVTNATAPSPLPLSRPPPGAPITTSEATTSARPPPAAASAPASSAPRPMRVDAPSSSERTVLGRSSAAATVAALSFSA
jgi:hypothetical protein